MREIAYRLAFALYTILVTFGSIRPINSVPLEHWDKLIHLIMYGVFAIIGYQTVKEQRHFIYLCIGIVMYSGALEIAQSFIPGRAMSAYDLLANAMGVFLGAITAKKALSVYNT
jgi:VanZ family protein